MIIFEANETIEYEKNDDKNECLNDIQYYKWILDSLLEAQLYLREFQSESWEEPIKR